MKINKLEWIYNNIEESFDVILTDAYPVYHSSIRLDCDSTLHLLISLCNN